MHAGQVLVVRPAGGPERQAEVLEVLGVNGGPPFLVRWRDTGRVAVFVPDSDTFVDHSVRLVVRRDHRCG